MESPIMNERTVSRMILFAMSRLTGNAAWSVAGSAGAALAHLRLGNEQGAHWNYTRARRYLRAMLKRGQYLPS